MNRAYVDANVLLRVITNDPPDMAESATLLLQRVEDRELELIVDPLVVAETVWVLSSFYSFPADQIAQVVQSLLAHPGIVSEDKTDLQRALTLYRDKNIDFIDAFVAAKMMKHGISEVYSFDKHFDRLESIHRIEPA